MWFLPLGRGQDEMVPQHVLWTVRSGASLAALLTPALEPEVKSHHQCFTRQTVKRDF